jgi:hypothetical protein
LWSDQDRIRLASKKAEWLSTNFEIQSVDGRTVATMHRPAINFLADRWDVKVSDDSVVDNRLMAIIAAYKTSTDDAQRGKKRR